MNQIKPVVHRFGAHLQFDEHGLSPYWGLVSVFDTDYEGHSLTYDAEDYEITNASYWQGKIAPPDDQEQIDGGLYEFKLGVWSTDEAGDKGADFTFRAGFSDAKHVDTDEFINGIPKDLPECIRVQVEATNLNRLDVLGLLATLAREIDLNPSYFDPDAIHDWSSIYGLECYVRIKREDAQHHLVGEDGLLADIASFGSGRGKGEHKWDHEEIMGHYEAVALDPESWDRLIDGHEYAQRLKCYQPHHPRAEAEDAEDDPLYHHKLEAQFWSGSSDSSIRWTEYDEAIRELRSTILHALSWAGLPTDHRAGVFEEDPYFKPAPLLDSITLQPNPIPEEVERSQRVAQDELVNPDITPAEFDVLEALRDHGSAHCETLANLAGRSKSTVYRAVERFDSILEVEQGVVEFVDDVVRQEIDDVIHRFKITTSNALDALHDVAAHLNPLAEDGNVDNPGPLARWINRHPIRVTSSRRGLEFEVEQLVSRTKLEKILEEGLKAAERSGMLTSEFERAVVNWTELDGEQHNNWRVVPDRKHIKNGKPVVLGSSAGGNGPRGTTL